MKRLYNSFLTQELGTEPIEYQTMLRYIRLLAIEHHSILVESDRSDHTVQEQTERTQFPKNYYRVAEGFPTGWTGGEPGKDMLVEDLTEAIPKELLQPWKTNVN